MHGRDASVERTPSRRFNGPAAGGFYPADLGHRESRRLAAPAETSTSSSQIPFLWRGDHFRPRHRPSMTFAATSRAVLSLLCVRAWLAARCKGSISTSFRWLASLLPRAALGHQGRLVSLTQACTLLQPPREVLPPSPRPGVYAPAAQAVRRPGPPAPTAPPNPRKSRGRRIPCLAPRRSSPARSSRGRGPPRDLTGQGLGRGP